MPLSASPPVRSLARLVAALVAVAAFSGVWAGPASAQVPIEDEAQQEEHAKSFFLRVADWYAQAEHWRDVAFDKANTVVQQTYEVMQLREKYESMAVGELGVLGDSIPDWTELAGACSVDVGGESICAGDRKLTGFFEGTLDSIYHEYTADVLDYEDDIDAVVHDFIGQGQDIVGDELLGAYAKNPMTTHLAQTRVQVSAKADESRKLAQIAEDLEFMLDSVQAVEVDSQEVSSGRAQQVSASLLWAEAMVELELARSRLRSLKLGVVNVSDDVQDQRRTDLARPNLGM